MIYEKLHLKEYFPQLIRSIDPTVEVYLSGYNVNAKKPCLVVCPGGGYAGTAQHEGEPIAMEFLSEGFNAFVLKYTCAPARFPTQLLEVAAVMELIYQNTEKWGCDTDKVSIIGFSAGGHLAAHYSTMYDCKEVREVFPESKSVNGTILSYPVITVEGENAHIGSFENLLGHYPSSEEEMKYFCLDRCVNEKTPPAFIWHTAEDNVVPVFNSMAYATALSKYKIPFELQIYPFGRHGLSISNETAFDGIKEIEVYNNKWVSQAKEWLKYMNLA